MSHAKKMILATALAASLLTLAPATALAQHVHGGVAIGVWGPPVYYPYPGPYYYYPYPDYYYGRPHPLGEVKLKSPDKNAYIFINGSFAGRARDMKHFNLAPGTYDIEQHIGNDVQYQRIYVVADHRVQVTFGPVGTPSPQPPPPSYAPPAYGAPPAPGYGRPKLPAGPAPVPSPAPNPPSEPNPPAATTAPAATETQEAPAKTAADAMSEAQDQPATSAQPTETPATNQK